MMQKKRKWGQGKAGRGGGKDESSRVGLNG